MDKLEFALRIISTLLLFGGLCATFYSILENNRLRKQEFYANLELSSNDIFKLTIDYPELNLLYHSEKIEGISSIEKIKIRDYTASVLNIFEIQYRLRKKNLIDAVVFASWMPWFWDVIHGRLFRDFWINELNIHYVPDFREYLNQMIRVLDDKNISDKKKEFYRIAAKPFNCKVILSWENKFLKPDNRNTLRMNRDFRKNP